VVNVDLPWNPAVLEQRIGRVHRLGQSQPVRVVNFVAQGTIEEGMLSVLKFKKSLFSGALDGGEKEVFLGGSRLNKFMETVEKTTSAIPEPAAQDPSVEPERDRQARVEEGQSLAHAEPVVGTEGAGIVAASSDPWSGLLQTGLSLLQQLAAGKSSAASGKESGGLNIVHRDPKTGESYLKIPAPSPEVVDRILGAVSTFLEQLRK